ncbi:MAG: ATP-binding protein [Fibrobacterota bacterium]|nr:ATP-binding protein [Fibrobacterota bacterium]
MDAGSAGFFLINLDGTVTPSAALADLASGFAAAPGNESAKRGDADRAGRISLNQALGLNADQEIQFIKWLDLVRKRHRNLRWDKLAPLAPVQEVWSGKGEDEGHVRLTYRKLEDSEGNLSAIAVFAIDTAPSRAMARQLEEERQRHKLEIRDVLALAANPPETVGAFLEDARVRVEAAKREWDAYLATRTRAGEKVPGLWKGSTAESPGQRLFRELHMVKGNAGAFGFESLAAGAQESEDLLEALKHPNAGAERTTVRFTSALSALRTQLDELLRAMKLIAGEGQDAMARILKWKMDRLVAGASDLDLGKLDPPLRAVIEATRKLPFLSPAYLTRKYRNLVERIARNLGKQVNFRVTSNTGDIHPESFSRVDEALVHILRNMVDHGIESPAERESGGKGEAEIGFEYVAEEDRVFLRVRDDGRGMNPAVIADRGVAMGLVTRAEADSLDDVGKLGLIFMERFTTRHEAGMVSGRGLGLALAARCVTDRGGNIYVYSQPGEGTRFAIELPPIGQKKLLL